MATALLTDLYELNMAAIYLRRAMTQSATFSLFVRQLPPERGFLVAAGLEDCLSFLARYRFEDEELAYCRVELGFDPDTIEAFRALRFEGDVWAVPEGRILFAGEPLLELTAPLPQAQLVETFLLNQITSQTTLASKAARCVIAAEGRDVVDFAFRRTQGIETAVTVARCASMVGFVATSNVEAARRYGLRAAGTMAHSFVEAFRSERDAFRAFARDFPDRSTFLVDTYDTLGGVRTAIEVVRELDLRGAVGIRLDSGDLAGLAFEARRALDEAGLGGVRIFASGGLDEHAIAALVRAGAPIDAFGVGTKMGVSADAPFLDSVYKLVEFDGRPVMKLSPGKTTSPGRKQVWRGPGCRDVIGLRDDAAPNGHRPLLEPVMRRGRRLRSDATALVAARERFGEDLATLPDGAKSLRDPVEPVPRRAPSLDALAERARAEITEGRSDADRTPR
ncbi:MAG: nicotinate phosphoribosyltransferase [Actinomycetota bacterium]